MEHGFDSEFWWRKAAWKTTAYRLQPLKETLPVGSLFPPLQPSPGPSAEGPNCPAHKLGQWKVRAGGGRHQQLSSSPPAAFPFLWEHEMSGLWSFRSDLVSTPPHIPLPPAAYSMFVCIMGCFRLRPDTFFTFTLFHHWTWTPVLYFESLWADFWTQKFADQNF